MFSEYSRGAPPIRAAAYLYPFKERLDPGPYGLARPVPRLGFASCFGEGENLRPVNILYRRGRASQAQLEDVSHGEEGFWLVTLALPFCCTGNAVLGPRASQFLVRGDYIRWAKPMHLRMCALKVGDRPSF